jgi:GNAT superfamily N-acetyltransferase
MDVNIRLAIPADIPACGQITHAAFKEVNERHGFENIEFPTLDVACQSAESAINNPFYYNIVAEANGQVIGLCFLEEHSSVRGVELVCVDPATQGEGVGRKLMEAALERSRDARGVRLLQHTFNTTSLALYASLGFGVKELLMLLYGQPISQPPNEVEIRPMHNQELDECGELCLRVLGFDRTNQIRNHIQFFTPSVALRGNRIVAYAAAPAMPPLNHVVAETEDDMKVLLLGISAMTAEPLVLLLPIRQTGLFRWCLGQRLKVVKPYTLMALGEYQEPVGCYLPSVLF